MTWNLKSKKYWISLFVVLMCLGCYKKPFYNTPTNIVFKVISKSSNRYLPKIAYPNFSSDVSLWDSYDEDTSYLNGFNTFKPRFSIKYDSMFYIINNTVTRKNYYFSLTYDGYTISENYDEANVRIDFYGFKVYNKNCDSVKLINNEVWIYCE